MMGPEWLGACARYNRWMNDKLYGVAATLSDQVRKQDCGAFFKTHRRGQITALLTQQGCDPGVTDLFAMLREEAARAPAS